MEFAWCDWQHKNIRSDPIRSSEPPKTWCLFLIRSRVLKRILKWINSIVCSRSIRLVVSSIGFYYILFHKHWTEQPKVFNWKAVNAEHSNKKCARDDDENVDEMGKIMEQKQNEPQSFYELLFYRFCSLKCCANQIYRENWELCKVDKLRNKSTQTWKWLNL